MADYHSQQRDYGKPSARTGPNPSYGPASSHQRDAAFSNIFGAAPPPGRSQIMTSQPQYPQEPEPGRTATMGSQTSEFMQRAPPVRQPVNGYPPQQQPELMVNKDQAGQHHVNNLGGQTAQAQRQPQPQYLPQPLRGNTRPYALPQRVDPRTPMPQQYNRPMTQRSYAPGPALNSDSYRSQSMATTSRPQMYQPPGTNYSIAPAHAFRQQPYMNHLARTTAQGRVVPDRPADERTMSMSSYTRDSEYAQTMSGRIIPNRRRDGSGDQEHLITEEHGQDGHLNGPPPVSPNSKGRIPSQGSMTSNSRTMSMASSMISGSTLVTSGAGAQDKETPRPSITKSDSQSTQQSIMIAQRRGPLVYAALLSRVALLFRERIGLGEKEKDGLVYKNAFTGYEAVDLIAFIIKTSDRNLALLLGRSLDAQKFFHEVAYAHRLRDSPNEVYQFKEAIMEETSEVNGVFTLLTECYSPTCTRDRLCYSIACPRRLEQQQRLNLRPQPGLKRADSSASLHEDVDSEQKLWINTVSKEIAESVDEKEKKRQEVISEIMYTERDFVKDLEYLRDFWIKPLRSTSPASPSPIPEHRREKFIRTVFSNLEEVYAVNSRMANALTRRQQEYPVVRNLGDIFLDFVPKFSPFIKYGSNQLFGKYEFEKEKASNPLFARFVDETERLKESRKLELNGYLTKPTTRLARYPLLLENVLKYTADDNPDKQDIPKATVAIRDFLSRVNEESGKSENSFNLMQLNHQLKWRNPADFVDLKLTEESRQLIFKGTLKKTPTDAGDIQAYLFDHAVLLVKQKIVNKREELKIYKKPIPLELLMIPQMDEVIPRQGIHKRPSSSMIPGARIMSSNTGGLGREQGYPITFKRLGKGGYETLLYCNSKIQQEKWMEHIRAQQDRLRERSNIFTKTNLCEGFFTASVRVNCCVPIDGGRKLVYGTDFGVYVGDRKPRDASQKPKRVLDCKSVTQIDVLEQHQILLVLSDKQMYSYHMDALDPSVSATAPEKKGRKICHANFFRAGVCQGQPLVCCVKSASLSSTVKVYEPMEGMTKGRKKGGFSRMIGGGQDVLKPYKEFYIPTESNSIHFLRSKLCVGCARGFEIVSLDSLETQSLLDQADTSLDFVSRSPNAVKPIYIERTQSEFLLCYTDFSFFVNRNGWRARPDWRINWEGEPRAFATWGNQWILGFEQEFIEIRHLETSALVHILTARNIRFLHSSSRELLYAYEDELGEDVVASLDFWGRPQSPPSQ
ncbi:RHO1 GDP-GTP exchange protein 2 [Elasticomyces elasticus]|nr:RHO1 GDP-GTP exchange protein 2 [Elasticomyces elasticus]